MLMHVPGQDMLDCFHQTPFILSLGYLFHQQCLQAIPDQVCDTHVASMYSLNNLYGTEDPRYFEDICWWVKPELPKLFSCLHSVLYKHIPNFEERLGMVVHDLSLSDRIP